VIDEVLDWALPLAERVGVAGLVVACEPTGDRASVRPILVARAREAEDATKNRADFSDATLIARLASERRGHVRRGPLESSVRSWGSPQPAPLPASAARQGLRDLWSDWPALLPAATRVIATMDEETSRRRPFEGAPPFRCPAVQPRRASGAVGAPGGVTSEVGAAAERAGVARSDWQRALSPPRRRGAHDRGP